jgi:two-component system alkaline phosphatase synthesis response regulator PhoP
MSYRILLVEDEENLLRTIRLNLELEGYTVVPAMDGKQAIKEFRGQRFDLVVLDVMLPEVSGFDVCQAIRLENKEIPVLFLTAKGSSDEKVKGLKLGADDYMTKPFNLEEFLLRVHNLIKRSVKSDSAGSTPEVYSFGNNKINFTTYEIVDVNGEKLQ